MNIQFNTDQYEFMYGGCDLEIVWENLKAHRRIRHNGELTQAAARLSEMEQNRGVAFFTFLTNLGLNGIPGLVGYAGFIERVAWLADVSVPHLLGAARITGEQLKSGTRAICVWDGQGPIRLISTETSAALAGISEPEFIEFGVREGIIWTPEEGFSKFSPPHRPPVLLTNMEQIEGSIQWLSRSVVAVSQSQPGDSIRLPQQDFRNL